MKKTNKKLFMLVATTMFLCVVILVSVLMTKMGPQQKITNQLELGNRYLTEMDYEQAIVAFEQVIEIDPMNADAYLGLTDAYICLNEFDKAYETAKQGYDKTGDERLNEKNKVIIAKLLELGNKYLTEMNYEQAIVAFEQVIKIDPMNADAYLGLTDAYICLNEFDKAYKTAKQGYEKTGDERLNEKILMIESGNIVDFEGRKHKATGYGADGSIEWEYFYTYGHNEYGLITHVKELFYEEGYIREEYTEIEFDENGIEISTHYNQNGNMTFKNTDDIRKSEENKRITSEYTYEPETGELIHQRLVVWEYGQNNKVEKTTDYEVDIKTGEKLIQKNIFYEYDENNNCIAHNFYDADGNLISREEWSYDAERNPTERRYYNADGTFSGKQVMIYDDSGAYIGYKEYDGNGNIKKTVMVE